MRARRSARRKTTRGASGSTRRGGPSYAAAADARKTKAFLPAVKKHLDTPSGPMMNGPAYTRFHEDIGKVTIKNPGIDENAAVYNSACAWYAFAMFQAGLADEGWRYLRGILTGAGGNTLKRSGQLPIYLPNFYKGVAVGRDAGETSHSPSTGTADWYYHTAVAMLFGVRGEFGGLRLDPKLPSAWKTARVWRRFRGAEYDIEMRRSRAGRPRA